MLANFQVHPNECQRIIFATLVSTLDNTIGAAGMKLAPKNNIILFRKRKSALVTYSCKVSRGGPIGKGTENYYEEIIFFLRYF